jgi:hypothetical protein
MALITIEKEELKKLIKESIRELFQEEELEDLAFGKIIEEGDSGDYISKKEIFRTLDKIK